MPVDIDSPLCLEAVAALEPQAPPEALGFLFSTFSSLFAECSALASGNLGGGHPWRLCHLCAYGYKGQAVSSLLNEYSENL